MIVLLLIVSDILTSVRGVVIRDASYRVLYGKGNSSSEWRMSADVDASDLDVILGRSAHKTDNGGRLEALRVHGVP
jgi:hypothetical protein